MSDNGWYFLAVIVMIVFIGLKLAALLLVAAFIYWLVVTGTGE